eukprot:860160-Pleurochrysis_carterae.AAC.1
MPSPVPPLLSYRSNTLDWNSSAMPGPVSRTAKVTCKMPWFCASSLVARNDVWFSSSPRFVTDHECSVFTESETTIWISSCDLLTVELSVESAASATVAEISTKPFSVKRA